MKLSTMIVTEGVTAHYRPGTSDEGVLKEVIVRHCYARRRAGFDVMPGEKWLDLGANIGAFALYAKAHGAASVDGYEPDPDCFDILQRNCKGLGGLRIQAAVTNRKEKNLPFRKGRDDNDHYRATILQNNRLPAHPLGTLPNLHASAIRGRRYDGVKMDIEGSEFGLIDDELIPKCDKLVMEYHFLRDERDINRFRKRMNILAKYFKHIWFPAFIQKDIEAKRPYSGRLDTQIFCWERK